MGANIPSTLAEESSDSLSVSLMLLFFGSLYAEIRDNKYVLLNGALIFLILVCLFGIISIYVQGTYIQDQGSYLEINMSVMIAIWTNVFVW